jgi:predicted nucleotidyltransferase component of viral defense system
MRLKIEINCREHFTVLGWQHTDFKLESSWFSESCQLTTFKLEELLGTKVRALYQRRKGRDLYDLYKALITNTIDMSELSRCYHEYMAFSVKTPPSKREFLLNLENKMKDSDFIGDTVALLRPEEEYKIFDAYNLVRDELLEVLF